MCVHTSLNVKRNAKSETFKNATCYYKIYLASFTKYSSAIAVNIISDKAVF